MPKFIPPNKQKLVYLKWQDAHSNSGWFSEDELKEKIKTEGFICEEVGWVVAEDRHEIHLVSRRAMWDKEKWKDVKGIGEYGLYQRIPRTWILERKEIRL